jgi:hypothetical protein
MTVDVATSTATGKSPGRRISAFSKVDFPRLNSPQTTTLYCPVFRRSQALSTASRIGSGSSRSSDSMMRAKCVSTC